MKKIRKILCTLIFPISLFGQDKFLTLEQFISSVVQTNNFNGNILVAKGGRTLFNKTFGYKNYSTKELLDTNSVFDICSMSKQFTAMGILLLEQQGKLELTDTLRKFFPNLPHRNVTIKNLLTHTSGIPDATFAMVMSNNWDKKKVAFNEDMIRYLAEKRPVALFRPGTKWEYSNTGYDLLASIIEKVSELSLKDFLKKEIFDLLGMRNTCVFNTRRSSGEQLANYAYGYVNYNGKYVLPDSVSDFAFVKYLDGLIGAGGIQSTVGDLLIWDRALKNNSLINEELQNEMLSPKVKTSISQHGYYGYGVNVDSTAYGVAIMHTGGYPGYSNVMTRYVKDDITIISLSNNETFPSALTDAITSMVLGQKLFSTPPIACLNTSVGTYISEETGNVVTITKKDSILWYNTNLPNPLKIYFKSDSDFFSVETASKKRFAFDKAGNVIGFTKVHEKSKEFLKKVEVIKANNMVLEKYSGSYMEENEKIKLIRKNDSLWFSWRNGDWLIHFVTDTKFYMDEQLGALYSFIKDKKGNIAGYTRLQNKEETIGKRIKG